MAKKYGNNRAATAEEMSVLHEEVEEMRASGDYSLVEEYNGGYLAIENSSKPHSPEEIEAARYMAKNGNKLILKNESGSEITVDGWINGKTYEQVTPTGSSAQNIKKALGHAKDKGARVSVIYMKNARHTLKSVEDGLAKFERYNPNYRFDEIIVVTKDGRLHYHVHNT